MALEVMLCSYCHTGCVSCNAYRLCLAVNVCHSKRCDRAQLIIFTAVLPFVSVADALSALLLTLLVHPVMSVHFQVCA